jgi:hypothetical protein
MTPEQFREVQRRMAQLDDRSLIRIPIFEADDYQPEALAAAQDELRRRNLPRFGTKEEYYAYFPGERITDTGFCAACFDASVESPPIYDVMYTPFIGRGFVATGPKCSACGSIVHALRFYLFFVPIRDQGTYKVIYTVDTPFRTKFVARKQRSTGA